MFFKKKKQPSSSDPKVEAQKKIDRGIVLQKQADKCFENANNLYSKDAPKSLQEKAAKEGTRLSTMAQKEIDEGQKLLKQKKK